ncbi:MAG: hypothetical protein DMF90_06760 [Acidobacteria bacterium]|nr:MAG: hypothetical protein DMF90_06760 [Acidobacteriota bacterium]
MRDGGLDARGTNSLATHEVRNLCHGVGPESADEWLERRRLKRRPKGLKGGQAPSNRPLLVSGNRRQVINHRDAPGGFEKAPGDTNRGHGDGVLFVEDCTQGWLETLGIRNGLERSKGGRAGFRGGRQFLSQAPNPSDGTASDDRTVRGEIDEQSVDFS